LDAGRAPLHWVLVAGTNQNDRVVLGFQRGWFFRDGGFFDPARAWVPSPAMHAMLARLARG
jgi:hypothetical protein